MNNNNIFDLYTGYLLTSYYSHHTVNRSVKGINLLNCLYHAKGTSLPVAFELVKKPTRFCDLKTKKEKRKSEVTKNEQLRAMLKTCCQNQLKWRYVLTDSWFSSTENMKYIHEKLKKFFYISPQKQLACCFESGR